MNNLTEMVTKIEKLEGEDSLMKRKKKRLLWKKYLGHKQEGKYYQAYETQRKKSQKSRG